LNILATYIEGNQIHYTALNVIQNRHTKYKFQLENEHTHLLKIRMADVIVNSHSYEQLSIMETFTLKGKKFLIKNSWNLNYTHPPMHITTFSL